MRFRAGLCIGFASGFYVGAMAGRERYEQINRTLSRAKRSDAIDAATGKAKAVVDLGVERARDIVETKLGRDPAGSDSSAPMDAGPLSRTPGQRRFGEETSKAGNGDSPS